MTTPDNEKRRRPVRAAVSEIISSPTTDQSDQQPKDTADPWIAAARLARDRNVRWSDRHRTSRGWVREYENAGCA